MTLLLCNITVGASLTNMLASHEVLAYADRMVANREVSLTVIKFLSCNNVGDSVMEQALDKWVVTSFCVKNVRNWTVVYVENLN